MTLKDIKEILEAEVIVGDSFLDQEVKTVAGADLLSDVLAAAMPGALLLTGQTNPQVVRTAEVSDLAAICFVRGKNPDRETIEAAESKNIPLMTTHIPMFESCGRLWVAGLRGRSDYERRE
jgi:predicted transcriptional regulator